MAHRSIEFDQERLKFSRKIRVINLPTAHRAMKMAKNGNTPDEDISTADQPEHVRGLACQLAFI